MSATNHDADLLDAAANDEIDALTAGRDEALRRVATMHEALCAESDRSEMAFRERDEAIAERDRLRHAIRHAPHANHCDAKPPMWPGPCNCWKRDALTEGQET